MKNLFLIIVLVFIYSCTKGAKKPEDVIKNYIIDISKGSADIDYFKDYTTGKLLETISALSEEDFEKFLSKSKVSKPRIKIINKNCTNKLCNMTYLVKFNVLTNGKKSFETEVKKLAEVVNEEGFWRISSITNLKTYHEATEPIDTSDN